MKNLNRAFTLTELLVALAVIGILCAILLPVIFNLMPNQNVVMAKRAFYTTQTVIADLINSEACYPDKTSSSNNSKRIGFDDGFGYPNCSLWGGDYNTGTITSEGDAEEKFLTLFEDKLDVLPSTNYPSPIGIGYTFSTTDGMEWVFTSAAFSSSGSTTDTTGGSILLTVDVNGSDTPNCGSSSSYVSEFKSEGSDCSSRTSGYDRFQMTIYGNGKIEIIDDWAREAVKVNKDITEE